MEIGYEPGRIRSLNEKTVASIDSLRKMRSSDFAAAEALRSVGYGGPVAVEVEASADPVEDLRRSATPARGLVASL